MKRHTGLATFPFFWISWACLVFLGNGCGGGVETSDRALRTERDVVDVRISSSEPDASHASEAEGRVGFDTAGNESRMLLYFPKLDALYEKENLESSLGAIEILVFCREVPVNPENIELRALSRGWTGKATWRSPIPLLPGKMWATPGGDKDDTLPIVHPSLRRGTDSQLTTELSFDVSAIVRAQRFENKPHHGFAISVRRDDRNARHDMSFITTNAAEGSGRPAAILTFQSKDTVMP